MLLAIILYFVNFVPNTYPLLCYNGTFTNWRYGEDPVLVKGLFGPSRTAIARTRCSLTVSCARIEIKYIYTLLMLWNQWWFGLVLFFFDANAVLHCYNCSSTHRDWNQCGGDFAPITLPFNTTRKNLINCTGENAMCFVRSWSARSRHAWIVQRGCYQATAEDILPRSMNTPTRAMTCKLERHPDAEYKVCLCQADWCNSASTMLPTVIQYLAKLPRYLIEIML